MGRKPKYTKIMKIQACIDYLSGTHSVIEIAQKLNMPKHGASEIHEWIKKYESFGANAFEERQANKAYSKEFKLLIIQEYLSEDISLIDLSVKYDIPSKETIRKWVLKYNDGEELLDYTPKPEVYVMARVKTTKDERIEIVQYCLDNQKNYKECASKYGVSYAQVYDWVKRYLKDGEEGLNDDRGHKRDLLDLSDTEKKDRELKRLKQKNLLLERENELLKKRQDLEAKLRHFQVTKK